MEKPNIVSITSFRSPLPTATVVTIETQLQSCVVPLEMLFQERTVCAITNKCSQAYLISRVEHPSSKSIYVL